MRPISLARLLAGALALSATAALAAQAEFYASNETGMAFEELPEFRNRDFEYNLEIRRVPGGQSRTVYRRDGSEFRRWEYDQDPSGRVAAIRFFESGILKERESYRADGRLEKFEEYGAKGMERATVYEYSGKRLDKAKASDASGKALYEDSYRYAINGSLREVRRSFPDGSAQAAGLDLIEGRIADSWYSKDGKSEIDRYSGSGRPTDAESWEEGKLLRSDASTLRDNGKDKGRQLITDAARGIEIERLFDEKGRLAVETARKDGKVESRTEYDYDGSGRLSEKRFLSPGRKNVVKYGYAADGSKASEEETENGELVRRLLYQKDGSYWEEILHEGQVAVRVRWLNGWKREEEILRDGIVVRRREFK